MVKIVGNVSPNSLLQSNGASPIKPSGVIAAADTITTGIWNAGSVTSSSFITAIGNLRGLALGINTAPQANAGTLQLLPTANGVDVIVANRATDSSPTGDFLNFINAANNASLFKVDVTGAITIGTWSATKIGTVFGGTNADSSGSSGIISVNSGTWTFNNVLTTNRLLIAAAGNTITTSSNLTYDGTSFVVGTVGPHAIGTTAGIAGQALTLTGTQTAQNSVGLITTYTLIPSNPSVLAFGVDYSVTIQTQAASYTVANVASMNADPPSLVIGSGSTITNAATIRISGAPTGATNNYALWVVGSTTKLDGGLIMGAPTGGDKGSGTINVAVDIYKNNGVYTNPDYVFHEYFRDRV